MALPTATTIDNLTRCLRLPGLYPGGYTDQFIRAISFEEVSGYGRNVQINRATSLGSVANYDPGDALSAVPAVTALTTFGFQGIAGTAQVDVADIAASGDLNEQLELQVEAFKVGLVRQLSAQVAQGDGTGKNMLGLKGQVAGTGNVIDVLLAPPTLANYHRLVGLVTASDGMVGTGPDALVMSSSARRQLQSLIEASNGGSSCCYQHDETIDAPVMMFDGIPVYLSAGIAPASPTEIYCVKLRGPSGVRVLHVGGDSDEFGIVVDDVPNQMGVSERAKIVRGYYTVLYPEVGSVAAIIDADVSAFVP